MLAKKIVRVVRGPEGGEVARFNHLGYQLNIVSNRVELYDSKSKNAVDAEVISTATAHDGSEFHICLHVLVHIAPQGDMQVLAYRKELWYVAFQGR